jgi:hypothetical protein
MKRADLTLSPQARRAVTHQLRRIGAEIAAAHRELARCAPIVQRAHADFARSLQRVWDTWQRSER